MQLDDKAEKVASKITASLEDRCPLKRITRDLHTDVWKCAYPKRNKIIFENNLSFHYQESKWGDLAWKGFKFKHETDV